MTNAASEPIRAVDLFCGAGGLSWGLVQALREVAIDAPVPTKQALAELVDFVGVNHWKRAIETHEANHPWARHYHDDIANVNPREVFDEPNPDVTILSGGIECTHWSTARGGKPVDDQKRMPAWDFLTWVQKLRPDHVLVENVQEFQQWGPIEADGTPSRTGETFEQWINSLHSLGYSVEWDVLTAADYGDATSRDRLFILATREGTPQFPDPTHSDERADLPDHRTAAEIIDWSDPGGSIWTRDLEDGRRKPLKYTTMQRIAEGIRRHCDPRLEPFADALETIGRVGPNDDVDPSQFTSIETLRERVVPAEYAPVVADALDQPFLVDAGGQAALADGGRSCLDKQYGTGRPQSVTTPLGTITSGGGTFALATPAAYVLRQQSGGVPSPTDDPLPTISGAGAIGKVETCPLVMPRNGPNRGLHSNPLYRPTDRPLHTVTAKNHDGHLVTPSLVRYSHGGAALDVDDPMPTIATERGGVFALSSPYLCPLYNGRAGQRPRTRAVDRPLMTVPASKSPAGLATPLVRPFVDDCQGPPETVDQPLKTQPASDRFALCIPDLYPWGLDVRYRMLQPRELKRAQGFPDGYEILGTKTETTEQIGNAVPVTLAQRLVESLLGDRMPSLRDYVQDDPVPVDSTETASGGAVGDD